MGTVGIIVVYAVILGGMWFLLMRPQKKEQKRIQAMLADMEIGDTALTTSGFYGVIIDIIDIGSALVVFTQHFLTDIVGVTNGSSHSGYNVGNLFHIFNQLLIGSLYFFHGGIDYLDVVAKKRRICGDFVHIAAGLSDLFQCLLDQGKSFFDRRCHLA